MTEGKLVLFLVSKKEEILKTSGGNFVILEKSGSTKKKIPALAVRDILIFGETDISSKVFSLANKNHIPIHFLDGRGKFMGSAQFDYSKNVFLRREQFLAYEIKDEKLKLAKAFVNAKIHNENILLQKLRVSSRLTKIPQAQTIDELRGYEGASAKKFFECWKKENIFKASDFTFSGRIKRPPTDEINSLLSFVFSLLHAEIHTQLLIAGLDPYIGFLHEQRFGHAALASDFIEIFRGIADHFVIRSINRKEFLKEDFEEETGGTVKLSREGYGKFFSKWTQFLRVEKLWNDLSFTAVIERDIRKLVQYFMKDRNDFEPFLWQR